MRCRGRSSCVRSIAQAARNASRHTTGLAAQGERDTGPHHAPPECHRPATPMVPGGHDPGDLVAGLLTRDVAGHQVVHRLVDLGQVRVVDRTPGHPPHLDGRGLVAAGLMVECQVHERHVRGHVAHAAGAGHRQHGGRHVRRPGTRRQQHLADPQRQVERLVDLALSHDVLPARPSGSQDVQAGPVTPRG